MRDLKALVFVIWVLLLAMVSSYGHANPVANYKLVGKGQMTWFWFDVYKAKLLTPSGNYQKQTWPLALELIYQRDISRDDLIKATKDEWQRQQLNYQAQWLTKLEQIWPSVSENDSLLLFVDSDGVSHFYYNSVWAGAIKDPNFSGAFTAIWLSTNTLKPRLRDQLVGAVNKS
ncbi:chalcone isomerase family protein [Dasania marina]|uniref:chalcone isomerase family protein n=1 Tax=Dasania marina TaxID=471499 RepID=UPI00037134A1|nr:chalcone isomerase family protein [Dasania marina]